MTYPRQVVADLKLYSRDAVEALIAPEWEDVERVLVNLDGHTRSEASLDPNETTGIHAGAPSTRNLAVA